MDIKLQIEDPKPVLGLTHYRFYAVSYESNAVGNAAYERFRELVADERKVAKLTQHDLAAKLKKPQSFVSKYEGGERRLDVVEFGEVAKALGIDPIRFLRTFYSEET
jgi:hypothetical protein